MKTYIYRNTLVILLLSLFTFTSYADETKTLEDATQKATPETPRMIEESIYRGRYRGIKISMTRKLYDLGNQRFRFHAKATSFWGSISETEEFLWEGNESEYKIQPLNYEYTQSILGAKRVRKATFDWSTDQANVLYKGKESTVSISPGVLGPMTYQLALRLDVASQAKKLHYSFVQRDQLKHYEFEKVEAVEKASISDTVHIKRSNGSQKRQTEIWLDINQHFVLSALEQKKGKKMHSLQLQSTKLHDSLINTPYSVFSKHN